MADLRLVGNPRAAERLCDYEDDSDAVSSCFSDIPVKPPEGFCETQFFFLYRRALVTMAAATARGGRWEAA